MKSLKMLLIIITQLYRQVLPMPMFSEGGIFFVITGILLYLFRKNRKVQVAVFIGFTMFWSILMMFLIAPDLSITTFFTKYYEWMGIFAGIFMLKYNGQRGGERISPKFSKRLFYIFYPSHVYILFALSCLIIEKL